MELPEEVVTIAKAVDADEVRPLALDRRGRLARVDHRRASLCSGMDELRPSIVDILKALDAAEDTEPGNYAKSRNGRAPTRGAFAEPSSVS